MKQSTVLLGLVFASIAMFTLSVMTLQFKLALGYFAIVIVSAYILHRHDSKPKEIPKVEK